jgi:cell division transport system permease protein
MKFRTIRYYFTEAFRNMIRNRLMSVASILTVASCIFIVSVFYCLAANVDFFLNQLEGSLQIAVFLRDDLSPEEVNRISDRILGIPNVTSARYVPPAQALQDLIEQFDDPELFAGVEYNNPLRRSFDIEIESLAFHDEVIHALESLAPYGVDNIRHDKDIADMIRGIANVIRVICVVLILILAIISIVIITNTIRITVNARKTEIGIMKYVGATDWFIRWPFAIEGLLIGLIGGILPAFLCWAGYGRVTDMIQEGIPIIAEFGFRPGHDIFSYLFPFALLLGTFIGLTGSFLSIRKHLKV